MLVSRLSRWEFEQDNAELMEKLAQMELELQKMKEEKKKMRIREEEDVCSVCISRSSLCLLCVCHVCGCR
jgi:hypothetical protein